jgi:EipB-like
MLTPTRLMTMTAGAAVSALLTCGAAAPPAEAAGVVLTPHRAVYELKLLRSRGKREVDSVRGRILYDFSGSPCAGYALNFRQVSELDSGEGKTALSDLRATTWEEGSAKRFRFSSENRLNDRTVDTVDGEAERDSSHIGVKLAKPADKSFDLESGMVFPTEHMRRIIEAAREGKTFLELPVYDGSENGEKVYYTMTLIGHEIAPDAKVPSDAAGGQAALAGLKRWPVTISYFDRTDKKRGEQTPVYAISFELYENGISRALALDYDDFVVSGEMSQLEIKDAPACK